ncbi:helix-turn-helix domain-containing protein [Emcibacter sp.]|uniref:helix-turn-helix domain-containing protein n=1 Tax=Emcibacter sp. TaxID=1979954 RepID=UPI002AA772D0|nr:helix-turn-helix domain-containing protein [Emcibacter sp.]
MGSVQILSTRSLKPPHRLRFWNEIAKEAYSGTHIESDDDRFEAELWRWKLQDLVMIRPRAPRSIVRREATSGGLPSDKLVLHLQHHGKSRFRQGLHEFELMAGDMEINPADSLYSLDVSDRNDMLSVELPIAPLLEKVPMLESVMCRPFSGKMQSVQLLHSYIISLWQVGRNQRGTDSWSEGAVNAFYSLLASALTAPEDNADESTLLEKLIIEVQARLTDPQLCTESLAKITGVTPRTVQLAFAKTGMTPSSYITRARLDWAAENLRLFPERSVTEVAFSVGFNDASYFSRCFRNHFGVSPRAWR